MVFIVVKIIAADGSGSMSVNPTTVGAGSSGNSFLFIYTASEDMADGGLKLTIPSGWTTPQTSSGPESAGYVTVSSPNGFSNVINNLDSIAGWTTDSVLVLTLTRDPDDKKEGAASLLATVTTNAGVQQATFYYNYTTNGGSQNWQSFDKAGFWIKADTSIPSGTIALEITNSGTTDTRPIGALTEGAWKYVIIDINGMARNSVENYGISVPLNIFTEYHLDNFSLGPVTPGLMISGQTIETKQLMSLDAGNTLIFTYEGVTAPSVPGNYLFQTQQRVGAGGNYSNLSSSPSVNVPNPATAPSAPASISATPGNGQVVINWQAPSSDGSAAIIDYRVYRDSSQIATVNGLTYTNTGLVNGTTYSYAVDARNSVGIGPKSASVSTTPSAPSGQTCPSGQTGTPPNCTTPTSQQCPSGYTGTYPNCTAPTQSCPSGQTGTPPNCTTPGCPAGQIGTPPNCATSAPGNTAPGPVITNVKATLISADSQKVTWTTDKPSTSQVEFTPRGGTSQRTTLDESLKTGHEVLLTDLQARTFYDFTVWSRDGAGNISNSASYVLYSPGSPGEITKPTPTDTDGDGIPNFWETANGLNPNDPADAKLDPDKDGLTNLQEYRHGSDPNKADTDGDGMPDGWEAQNGLLVLKNDAAKDPDKDGFTNLQEYKRRTDPNVFNKKWAWSAIFSAGFLDMDINVPYSRCSTLLCPELDIVCRTVIYVLAGTYVLLTIISFIFHRPSVFLGSSNSRIFGDIRFLFTRNFRANFLFWMSLALAWLFSCWFLLGLILWLRKVRSLDY